VFSHCKNRITLEKGRYVLQHRGQHKVFGLEKDRKIKRGVQEIMRDLSQVKACPHFTFGGHQK
jgi:hypothetical protein